MSGEPDLFSSYPDNPGWKLRQTSREAAQGVALRAGTIRDRVLAAVREKPGTPEQVALRIGEQLMNCRPRFSELAAKGLIEDSGKRGTAMGGRQSIVWRAKAQAVAP